ncbi:MAG: sigma-54-dependent Fis family transcriptional regulator [Deltaproteobacteria bacterium]|nr:sigma-54-dependent Fis family transcriptional regulator [Deltaproteobacteria bacterium]
MPRYKIMIVDDEKSMREFLDIMLKKEGYDTVTFPSPQSAIEHFRQNPCDLVITDLKMPGGMGGVDFLKALKELSADVVVVMITAYASVDSAVEAMKAGAYDYFTKPFNVEEIKMHIKRAIEHKSLERENILLKKNLKIMSGFSNIIGTSRKMTELYGLIMSVAPTKTNILIAGESGTGKELVARAIHRESTRKERPFVTVNCGAIPESLLESELFGHVRGAFTGAVSDKTGLAELSEGGTLFLDEITELPLNLQVKLLRFIQERSFRKVGGTADIPVDIRLIAAANKDIEEEVRCNRFREDLFYRLNVIRIDIPPLRERKEDIPKIARYFVQKYNKEFGKDIKGISEEAMALLMDYDYSGNVRELENAIERAFALEPRDHISAVSLPPAIRDYRRRDEYGLPASSAGGSASVRLKDPEEMGVPPDGIDLEKTVSEIEKNLIRDALKKAGGVKKEAAKLLGISFRSIRYKLNKYE